MITILLTLGLRRFPPTYAWPSFFTHYGYIRRERRVPR